MINVRKANDRGIGSHDWLKSYHTFSFADYYDPAHMGFRNLRVINDDVIAPAKGFGTHPHNNMEIITYVISGALEHKDSMGTGSVIKPGEIQRMSAGTGITHSEFNHSKTEPLHLLQIWIKPASVELTPSYEQKTIPKATNQLILIGAQDKHDGAVTLHANAELYVAYMTPNSAISYQFKSNHAGWLQLITGSIKLNGETLNAGDGAAISDITKLDIQSIDDAELLLFDLV
jgi:quercetin 2,3-dioxygenase